jgi:hypothetical protein
MAEVTGSRSGSLDVVLAGTGVRLFFDLDHATARAEALEPGGTRPVVRFACWFAWFAAYPDTGLAPIGEAPRDTELKPVLDFPNQIT